MARVQVLRQYRPETFSGRVFPSKRFTSQREWARRVLRYKNRFAFTMPAPTRFDLLKSWLSWRGFYFVRAIQRQLSRLRRLVRR